jgi:hypothetical protein
MIHLQNNTKKLTINIEGYAYPFSREYWDANWLSIEILIYENRELLFNKNDTCLLTTELISLKDWLEQILKNDFKLTRSSIKFIEPCISFQADLNKLNIILKYNLSPLYEQNYDASYTLEFEINSSTLSKLINSIAGYIQKYPEKKA